MGWRVRRSVKLMPGVRLNFNKNGISTTIGGRGAHTTFGRGRVTSTFGIPGTGISYTSTSRSKRVSAVSRAEARQESWARISRLVCLLIFLASVACYTKGEPGPGTLLLAVALLPFLPAGLIWARRFIAVRVASRATATPVHRELDGFPAFEPATPDALTLHNAGKAARLAQANALAEERQAERVRLEETETQERVALNLFLDKVRVLLFLARDDGVVRAKERDIMVGYLSTQPNASDMNDTWLKKIHAKMPRDTATGVEEAVARLGSAGLIDTALINACEALVTLTKTISATQLASLSALRRERARGPWRPAAMTSASVQPSDPPNEQ